MRECVLLAIWVVGWETRGLVGEGAGLGGNCMGVLWGIGVDVVWMGMYCRVARTDR